MNEMKNVASSGASAPDWAAAAEARVLEAACARVADGAPWDAALASRAADAAGLSRADAALLLPQGPCDLAALLWRRHDARALEALGRLDPTAMKVRERIRTAVLARLDAVLADRAAVEASSLWLARPDRAGLALRLGWATADGLWRWAGDTATDENHYSKRALLWGVLAGTLAVRLARGDAAAERHLDARIEQVMRFERWKAGLPPPDQALTAAAAMLGRLRYRGGSPPLPEGETKSIAGDRSIAPTCSDSFSRGEDRGSPLSG